MIREGPGEKGRRGGGREMLKAEPGGGSIFI